MSEKKTIEDFIEKVNKDTIPNKLPAIATRTRMITYPNSVSPMYIGREKSLKALELALSKHNNYIFLISQKDIEVEEPNVKDLFRVGVVARIVQLSKTPSGDYKIIVEGIKRAKIKKTISKEKYFMFDLELMDSKIKENKLVTALARKVKHLFQKYLELTKKFPQEALFTIEETNDPEILSDLVASVLPIELNEKQEILETLNTKKRLEQELEILTREIELLEIEEKLEKEVRENIEKTQKEYYLKEKLSVIQKQLNGEADEEIVELKNKINEKKLPDEAKEKALKELERLSKMSTYSPEANVIRTYLDWILEFPWYEKTEDTLKINQAKKVLESNHSGLEEPKERILEYLAVRKLSKNTKTPILCFVGAPGVGKTTLGKSIAQALGRKFGRISLGGIRDESEIRGHRRTYVGAMPGRIVQTLRKVKVINPVIVLDEIDKMNTSFQGDPAAALLEVLDPEQNTAFVDHYFELPIDLSDTIFVTTANVIHTVPPALRDRMEIIYISGYTNIEKLKIAKKHILPQLLKEHGLDDEKISITSNALKNIISDYTREAGVRILKQQISKLLRKSALKYTSTNEKVKITNKNLSEFLGPKPFFSSEKNEKPEVGVVTGLAWTAYGGTTLEVEVITIPGKGKLISTGQLGDVMKESTQIALNLSRKIIEEIDEKLLEKFDKKDFHIHFPEGAVPKDGPSAGVTITTALISSISKKKVRNDIAMTGEITLRGKVLPIGGVKEKVISAYRAGIYEVILPEANKKDVEKIPEEVMKKMKINFAKTIDDVLNIALIGGLECVSKEC
ncbi:Lon protease [Tepiditoga spiralis]|uniref:Lon protease n=1 Tax=Tepiditoga spiralis TaxID=2108365 RepID=A0A7G1G650_9BACT|nr:endopeptidase La [Tepiditoga spiralis]BBE31635.1 Lon protease [Tepiditoga spiralis]